MSELKSSTQTIFSYHARWSDMDYNAHMGNAAYLAMATDARLNYFSCHGFPVKEFARLQVGPVIFNDTIDYFYELQLHESVEVNFLLDGLSPNGSRMQICNYFLHVDGKVIAKVVSNGGWLDTAKRQLRIPPTQIVNMLRELPKTDSYVDLKDSVNLA